MTGIFDKILETTSRKDIVGEVLFQVFFGLVLGAVFAYNEETEIFRQHLNMSVTLALCGGIIFACLFGGFTAIGAMVSMFCIIYF